MKLASTTFPTSTTVPTSTAAPTLMTTTAFSNYSNDNSHCNDIDKINSSPDKSEVTLARWIPSNKKIEGIRKFGDKQNKQFKI